MEIKKEVFVTVSAADFIENLSLRDVSEFCEAVAAKFNEAFSTRANLAGTFAEGISEQGCRWLAEVVTEHYARGPSVAGGVIDPESPRPRV